LAASKLNTLDAKEAENWAIANDKVAPESITDPRCNVDPNELRAFVDYYLVKRLGYQQAYFERQANKADWHSWSTRWKVSLWIFVFSVVLVFMHGIMAVTGLVTGGHSHGTSEVDHQSWLHLTELTLVALAAIFPVIGFGLRAWSAAFEFPRSRNLYRAKSQGLNWSIRAIETDCGDLTKTMNLIQETEHFFQGEHREWCRLQIESEWYV
jgi:hypothetical protein